MIPLGRRRFLQSGAGLAALSVLTPWPGPAVAAAPVDLRIVTRTIEVNGKAAKVFGLLGPDGKPGLTFDAGDRFAVRLTNATAEPALIHWHGLTPPNSQDGVPGVTQPHLHPGGSFTYDFPLDLPGTNWMHSHHSLQAQLLMSAPLIVRDPAEAGLDEQVATVMLNDFTFRDPAEILEGLRHGQMVHMDHGTAMPGMNMEGMNMPGMAMPGGGHYNDIDFDAYLANDRTLDDPEVVGVEAGGQVRLRIINAAASSNFMIDLGTLIGELIAVDGRPILPLHARRFALGMAQRADIRLRLAGAGAWPVLFQREGGRERTGIVLATPGAAIPRLAGSADEAASGLDFLPGRVLPARSPLPRRQADRRIAIELAGNMMAYSWGLQQADAGTGIIEVERDQRIEIEMINRSDMSHPMHLHGHHFQIVELNGQAVDGAVRDTELVYVNSRVTIAFDTGNPGRWMFHCHNLYHMLSGMMTEVRYT